MDIYFTPPFSMNSEPEFVNVKGAQDRFKGIDSVRLHRLGESIP